MRVLRVRPELLVVLAFLVPWGVLVPWVHLVQLGLLVPVVRGVVGVLVVAADHPEIRALWEDRVHVVRLVAVASGVVVEVLDALVRRVAKVRRGGVVHVVIVAALVRLGHKAVLERLAVPVRWVRLVLLGREELLVMLAHVVLLVLSVGLVRLGPVVLLAVMVLPVRVVHLDPTELLVLRVLRVLLERVVPLERAVRRVLRAVVDLLAHPESVVPLGQRVPVGPLPLLCPRWWAGLLMSLRATPSRASPLRLSRMVGRSPGVTSAAAFRLLWSREATRSRQRGKGTRTSSSLSQSHLASTKLCAF